MAIDIQRAILLIRGKRVMLDSDLAALYGVATKALVQAVRRNPGRFPEDFMFRLSPTETANLRSQTVTSSLRRGWGGRRHTPYAFTEQGVAMLSTVLRSRRAIEANITIMRTFVQIRRMLVSHEALAGKLAALEKKYDAKFTVVFDAIRELMSPPASRRRAIGFRPRSRVEDGESRLTQESARAGRRARPRRDALRASASRPRTKETGSSTHP
jgi:hypothetical protein